MSGLRPAKRFSDEKMYKILQIVNDLAPITPTALGVEARLRGIYKPRSKNKKHWLDRWFGNRVLKELLNDGLVNRAYDRSKSSYYRFNYSLTRRGIATLNLVKQEETQ